MKIASPQRIAKLAIPLLAALAALALASSASAATGSFTADLSVSQPIAMSPADGTQLAFPTDPVALRWSDVGGAGAYEVQIANLVAPNTTCSFANDTLVDTQVTTTSYVPTFLDTISAKLYGTGTYCWRVRPVSGSTGGTWSQTVTFVRTWTPNVTGLAFHNDSGAIPRPAGTPADSSTSLGGYLQWDQLPGAASYDVEISPQDNDFSDSSIVVSKPVVKGTRVLLPHLPDDTYVWRVRSVSSNGGFGAWTEGDPFTVAWTTIKNSQANVYPTDGSTQHDFIAGWDPVPGASFYQVESATQPGCFWDPVAAADGGDSATSVLPKLYSDWVGDGYPVSAPASVTSKYCRLADNPIAPFDGSNPEDTINDWATWGMLIPSDEVDEITNNGVPLPTTIYWRVRPVTILDNSTETGWEIGGQSSGPIYGRWLEHVSGGETRPYMFNWDATTGDSMNLWPGTTGAFEYAGDGTNCTDAQNNPSPGNDQCLIQDASQMSASNDSANSTSMQIPLLPWESFYPDTSLAGGSYIVQVASDPNFDSDSMLKSFTVGGNAFLGSWADQSSLPDNQNGSGYWWRVIPCTFTVDTSGSITGCTPNYYEAAAGLLQSSGNNSGAREFTKQVSIGVSQVANFADVSPLLQWSAVDGADHYDIQISQDPFFNGDSTTMETVQTSIVPLSGTGSDQAELGAGTWYWRVRAVAADDTVSGWSDVNCSGSAPAGCFTEREPAPTLLGPSNGTTTAWPLLTWSSVDSASEYDVQVSSTSTFDDGTIVLNQQTAQAGYAPDVPSGTWYWRVRVDNGGANQGLWSSVASFTTDGSSAIGYTLPKSATVSGKALAIDGTLSVDNTAASGKALTLYEKSGTCTASGGYHALEHSTSGSSGITGQVAFKVRADRNRCFRIGFSSLNQTHYSAPFQTSVLPATTVKNWPKKNVVARKAFRPTVTFKQAITGTLQFQIKIGKTWTTIGTKHVTRAKKFVASLKVPKPGSYPARMTVTRTGIYTNAQLSLPKLKVYDKLTVKKK